MERENLGNERLIVPTDFTSPAVPRKIPEDLIPPSHFASSGHSTGANRCVQIPVTQPPSSWINPGIISAPSGDPIHANPWLALTQAQQEILELRKDNQKLLMLRGGSIRTAVDYQSDQRARSKERGDNWSRWESEWRLEAEKHKAEAERLKGQVEALKEIAERCREEMRDKDCTLSRHSHEMEAIHEDLSKAKSELSQLREELSLCSAQKEKLSSQLDRLKAESDKEMTKMRRDVEQSKEESRDLALKVEMGRLQAEEEAKQQTLRLFEQLEEVRKNKEVELQQLNASHHAELGAAQKTNGELQDRLQSMTSELLQLKSTLMEVSTERNGLKEHLSQMGQAFEAQSTTLQSLRNYIGQLAPEKGEKERLNEAVERLNKEKAALQTTAELLTVRLNSVNEILALQEEKIVKKTSADPLVENGSEGFQMLQLWREKVFKLCVQLRLKDIEIREEKEKLISKVRSTEQQLQQEQHRASILQHSLHDKIAELDLERVEKDARKQDLASLHKENVQLKSQSQKAEAELKTLTEAVQGFCQAFESKVAEVEAAKSRLNTFTQRLTFAKRRVETVQALVMRRAALQKVEQACKQADKEAESIRNLQIEHSLVCEERDRLTQELKRTPELIEKALADLKEQYESKVRQQQQELEQSWVEVQQAVDGREEAEQNLQQIQAQLEDTKVTLERARCELLSQQEHSKQTLQERVSEIEDRCSEKLREMEAQVSTARKEHTKAVMTLRQFEREAARKLDEMKLTQNLKSENTKRQVLYKQLNEPEKDKNRHLVTVADRGLMNESARAYATARQNSAAPWKPRQNASERSCSAGAQIQLPADERLLCVLEELHTLSATVVNSSEDSAEEEGQSDSVEPSTGSRHS
ncbi:coiled-coil alpha-helical rod protein 1 [Archocentrus centrarchus]|uniref:coiled-coil alpha-helical rod protein 1 n=1 Tax=Archocentrus centrarchus TaxID=63155 RepID=UPI0011EA205D|nr:coiled-coil alpha-helical rod protein 1 [Archocentrus centrarchus]